MTRPTRATTIVWFRRDLRTADQQKAAGCVIGVNYPAPMMHHARARRAALDMCADARERAAD